MRTMHCSECRGAGHNRLSCPQLLTKKPTPPMKTVESISVATLLSILEPLENLTPAVRRRVVRAINVLFPDEEKAP